MAYITRDGNGKIASIFANQQYKNQEFLPDNTPEILNFGKPSKKDLSNQNILSQISELEKSQARSLREMIISPNDYAKNKLTQIDDQIEQLRTQLT